jgi:hypothetical protein
MQSTLVQQVPGVEPVDCLSTLHSYSDAGCADLPLTLLGAPVSIVETRVTVSKRKREKRKREEALLKLAETYAR